MVDKIKSFINININDCLQNHFWVNKKANELIHKKL